LKIFFRCWEDDTKKRPSFGEILSYMMKSIGDETQIDDSTTTLSEEQYKWNLT